MAALTVATDRTGVASDAGLYGLAHVRTVGPAVADRPRRPPGHGTVRSWPLLVLAAPAAAEVREVACLATAISEEMNLPLSGYVNVVLVSAGCQG